MLCALACGGAKDTGEVGSTDTFRPTDPTVTTGETADSGTAPLDPVQVDVTVTLDGAPVEGALVVQGGRSSVEVFTDASGAASVVADLAVVGDHMIVAAHPDARSAGVEIPDGGGAIAIELTRYDTSDNLDYSFQPAGSPDNRDSTLYCAHCHVTLVTDWYASPHRTAASNPVVHDLYAGAAAAWSSEGACSAAGGRWWEGVEPGTAAPGYRCYLGDGALPALNEGCGDSSPCDGVAAVTGGCADCHAPAIDGELGGRDLLEATGIAYDEGVTCDLCHKVRSVDLDAELPGVGGALAVLRPSEPPSSPLLGEFQPLFFGPYADVLNPAMSASHSELFHEAELCAGCHEHDQPVLVPGEQLDPARWPDGALPIQSTYSEWAEGALGSAAVACQACHMPPAPEVGNAADLYNIFEDVFVGVSGGWERAPGEVRHHAWFGPRQPESQMLELAAALELSEALDGADWVAQVTVRNAGAGHALPTGEPMRHVVLVVTARCGGEALEPVGGDAVPDLGGALDSRGVAEDWASWPGAAVGDLIRVVRQDGWREDPGPGAFGDGTFTGEARGLPQWTVVGASTVLSADADGAVTLDAPLPAGDVAYRVRAGEPEDGAAPGTWAGAAGHAFAKVLTDGAGRRMVPHFLAVDVASDNRLMPAAELTTEHRFPAACADPDVTARLLYRSFPRELAAERGWDMPERVIAEVTR